MFTKREILIFAIGAQAFHTLSHIILGLSNSLPMRLFSITVTCHLNVIAILVNTAITAALCWLLSRTKA